jgi:hypothetical protein
MISESKYRMSSVFSSYVAEAYLVQGEARVSGDGEIEVQRKVQDILLGVPRVGGGLDLAQAVADEPDAVHQQTVGGTLNLEVAEEGVGAEEGEDLVEDIVALTVGVGRLVGGQGWRWDRQDVGRPAGLCPEREEREVADEARRVRVRVENGVIGLVARKRWSAEHGHWQSQAT